jgi:hypothetical protein
VRGLARIENIHRLLRIFYLAIMHRFSNFDTGQTVLEDKDMKLFFQGGRSEDCEWCIGISCESTYQGVNSTESIVIQIKKTGFVVNIDFRSRKIGAGLLEGIRIAGNEGT